MRVEKAIKKEGYIVRAKGIHSNKNILCIDIDNVIALTDKVMRSIIFRYTSGRVNLNYEDIIDFDYCKAVDPKGNSITKNEWIDIHCLFSLPQNLSRIKPYSNIQTHLSILSTRYNIHLVTSRLKSGWFATLQWLERHHVPYDGIHFVKHLEKHIVLGNADAIIEDDFQQALYFAESGINAYIIEHPWNIGRPGRENMFWVTGWENLIKKLMGS